MKNGSTTRRSRWKHLRSGPLLIVLIFCGWVMAAFGQNDDPFSIRVESNQVLVRAQVFRKGFRSRPSDEYYFKCMDKNWRLTLSLPFSSPYVTDEDCFKSIEIEKLEAEDFHVSEDGKEQKVDHVVRERAPWTIERDLHSAPVRSEDPKNDYLEFHRIWSYTPRGIWRSADLPLNFRFTAEFYYRISYVPQKLKPGGCHRIKVMVAKHRAEVLATDRYCYIPHSPGDALAGTGLEKSMVAELGSDFVDPVIPLVAQSGFFYAQETKAKVNIVLSFPPDMLKGNWNGALQGNIGVMGVVHEKNGTEVARFSDAAIVKGDPFWSTWNNPSLGALPSRYETQVDLSPGQYELRISLSDGTKFGRVVIPIVVDKRDDTRPTLSSLFLFKRFRNAGVAEQEAEKVNIAPAFIRLVSQEINITPTADPTFHTRDVLPVYFEVYEPGVAPETGLTVETQMRIVDAKSGAVKKTFPWFDAAPYWRQKPYKFAIHKFLYAGELPVGEYRLEAQARDSLGRASNWQGAEFTIK